MSMTRQQRLDAGTRWRRAHGIQPRGARKDKKIVRGRVSKLREMSFRRLGHEPISGKWIEAVNEKMREEKT